MHTNLILNKCLHCGYPIADVMTQAKFFKEPNGYLCNECVLRAVIKIATNLGHNVSRLYEKDDNESCIMPHDLRCSKCDAQYTVQGMGGILIQEACYITDRR